MIIRARRDALESAEPKSPPASVHLCALVRTCVPCVHLCALCAHVYVNASSLRTFCMQNVPSQRRLAACSTGHSFGWPLARLATCSAQSVPDMDYDQKDRLLTRKK